MATLTTHVLDGVLGCSAAGVRLQLYRVASETTRTLVFDVRADQEGRIDEVVDLGSVAGEFELHFHARDYFGSHANGPLATGPMNRVVFSLTLSDDDRRYHIPLILSPHSCSTWWSG